VTVIAAILTYAFSSSGTSHAILLAGMVITTLFLGIESRRYQDYDIYRARIRMIQENLFANALDPSAGVEHTDWRRELSDDLRHPSVKIRFREAVHRRLRRVYLALLVLLLAAWIFRITALSSKPWLDSAAFGTLPGSVVIGAVALFYLAAVVVTNWPLERQAKGEFDEVEHGDWKESE
jgi:uncharacterized membrane protein